MRALILSWEYPPLNEGGLARHVRKLAENLVTHGVQVHVLARGLEESPPEQDCDGVVVHTVREPQRPRELGEFVTWVEHMNADMSGSCCSSAGSSTRRASSLHSRRYPS